MSFNLEGIFNMALDIQAKEITYHQISSDTSVTMKASTSNYYRNLQMLEEMVSKGREFIISKKIFEANFTGIPVRGDRIISSDIGNMSIIEVREMIVLGAVVGYRVRCD